jgi:hypothetical protein
MFRSLQPQKPVSFGNKRYWGKMALSVAAAVTLTVLLTASILAGTYATVNSSEAGIYSTGQHTVEVLSGSVVLNTKGSYLTGFEVPPNAKNATLQGNYYVVNGTAGNAASLTVWSQQQFLNYFANKNAQAIYNKGLMPIQHDTVDINVSEGYYLILVSGTCNQQSILEANFTLSFTI